MDSRLTVLRAEIRIVIDKLKADIIKNTLFLSKVRLDSKTFLELDYYTDISKLIKYYVKTENGYG
jgi:hypothetical protein